MEREKRWRGDCKLTEIIGITIRWKRKEKKRDEKERHILIIWWSVYIVTDYCVNHTKDRFNIQSGLSRRWILGQQEICNY